MARILMDTELGVDNEKIEEEVKGEREFTLKDIFYGIFVDAERLSNEINKATEWAYNN